jgi:signal transduction histidine kinase
MCEGVVAAAAAASGMATGASPNDAHERLVGKVAGSVAHDFNNLLAVMLSSLEDARHMLSPNSPATKAVDLTVRAARRSSMLARRLMEYSRNRVLHSGQTHEEQVDIARLIENLQTLLARAVTSAVKLELYLPEDPIICQVDGGRLEDALMNLCLNARDAMPDGGVVRVSLKKDAGMAVITVADSGVGMAPDVLARAMERNFTTKRDGRGSGFGLWSVKEFVESVGGEIRLESEVGRGTKVELRLLMV